MKKLFLITILCYLSAAVYAQSIVLTSGSLEPLKEEKVIKFEFTYENMLVGKMTEEEYVLKKVSGYNEKDPGRGDEWREKWFADRINRFEPKFIELFDKYMEKVEKVSGEEGANYVILLNTEFTEPGWNVGVMRMNASIDMRGKILNIASGEQIATFVIKKASASNFMGTDFDTGFRIQETYGKAGREFAKFLIKKGKFK
ncbi:MAG: hypothetical protein LUH22_11820 [Bacteroides sp.]|nr:hypothetical protein [Bacteroides sp.]